MARKERAKWLQVAEGKHVREEIESLRDLLTSTLETFDDKEEDGEDPLNAQMLVAITALAIAATHTNLVLTARKLHELMEEGGA
jgi:hypothetical protein